MGRIPSSPRWECRGTLKVRETEGGENRRERHPRGFTARCKSEQKKLSNLSAVRCSRAMGPPQELGLHPRTRPSSLFWSPGLAWEPLPTGRLPAGVGWDQAGSLGSDQGSPGAWICRLVGPWGLFGHPPQPPWPSWCRLTQPCGWPPPHGG